MDNQRQQPQQQEEQPRMNFLSMMLMFLLIRNVMNTFTNPPQPKTPESIIDNYNQTYKSPEQAEPVMGDNPISSMMGMMKGMMPLKKGIKGKNYSPSLLDGESCV